MPIMKKEMQFIFKMPMDEKTLGEVKSTILWRCPALEKLIFKKQELIQEPFGIFRVFHFVCVYETRI